MDLRRACEEASRLFESHDVGGMRRLYGQLLTECAVEYDEGAYRLALIMYVLSKVTSKQRFQTAGGAFVVDIVPHLRRAAMRAEGKKRTGAIKELALIHAQIESADERDRRYLRGLFSKAAVKAASTLYAKGISLGRSAEISGIAKHEILAYAGTTAMNERVESGIDIGARMRRLRELFR